MNGAGLALPAVANQEIDHMSTKPAADPREDRDFVTALARGLEVLACFGSGDKVLGPTEISQA
ncbi:MAG TPA: hypothetical protein PK177_01260, partial [Burkholderiaceae bacterium]|nr:hypothetical protein [Burkholderiaceae bacterium]